MNSTRSVFTALRNVLAAGALALCATACAGDDPRAFDDPAVVAKLREIAQQAASGGEATPPTKMYAVAVSDHQVAEQAASGAIINDHAPVFVIVITGGTFTAREAPPGAVPFEGSVLTLTVIAATYEISDVGIVNVEPDLSKVASDRVDLSTR
ncbi:MAG TPA: hypothetical protein VJU61_04135 [Polyangiaceae bacterium]|nr:hypothetical protein [Polyangiaceae bacterium]